MERPLSVVKEVQRLLASWVPLVDGESVVGVATCWLRRQAVPLGLSVFSAYVATQMLAAWRCYRRYQACGAVGMPGQGVLIGMFARSKFYDKEPHETLYQEWKALGFPKLFKYRMLGYTTVALCAPELFEAVQECPKGHLYEHVAVPLIGHSVLTLNGQAHRKRRKVMNPAFSSHSLGSMAPNINLVTQRWVRLIRDQIAAAPSGTIEIDLLQEMSKITMDIIMLCGFGHDTRTTLGDSTNEEQVTAVQKILEMMTGPFVILPGGPRFVKWMNMKHFRATDRLMYPVIDNAQAAAAQAAAAQSQTDDTDSKRKKTLVELILESTDENGKRLSRDDMRKEGFIFFLAGHETTSLNLTWTLGELSRREHEETQAELAREGRSLIDSEGGGAELCLGPSAVGRNLPKLTAALKEGLRRHPPINVARSSVEDMTLGGVHVPEGCMLGLNVYNLHHDPNVWQNPEEFQPSRFMGISETDKRMKSFSPFTLGPRVCLGQALYWLEARVIAATILATFKLEIIASPFPAVTSRTGTMKPKTAMMVRASLRE